MSCRPGKRISWEAYLGDVSRLLPLLHNHLESDESQFRYPWVQYKVTRHTPMLLGINEFVLLWTKAWLRTKQ